MHHDTCFIWQRTPNDPLPLQQQRVVENRTAEILRSERRSNNYNQLPPKRHLVENRQDGGMDHHQPLPYPLRIRLNHRQPPSLSTRLLRRQLRTSQPRWQIDRRQLPIDTRSIEQWLRRKQRTSQGKWWQHLWVSSAYTVEGSSGSSTTPPKHRLCSRIRAMVLAPQFHTVRNP